MKGIRYYSFAGTSGYGLAAKAYMRGLSASGVPISWHPMVWRNNGFEALGADEVNDWLQGEILVYPELLRLLHQDIDYSHVVMHVVPEYWPQLYEENKINVGYTAWETDELPRHWPPLLEQTDAVFIPSNFNLKVFENELPNTPIKRVPHAVHAYKQCTDNEVHAFRIKYQIPLNSLVFYTINCWNVRKDMALLLHSFLLNFTDDDGVCLIIKTNSHGPRSPKDIKHELVTDIIADILLNYHDAPKLIVIADDQISTEEMSCLHDVGDCYISLTHGEGWGMGAAEAASASNPVLMTGWGGQLDFLGENYAGLLDYSLVPVFDKLGEPSFMSHQNWAKADLVDVMDKLQSVYDGLGKWKKMAIKHQPFLELFSTDKVCEIFHDHLKAVKPKIKFIPKHFHFVFGLKPQVEEFHISYYLCLRSCIEVNQPDQISFYYHFEPHGEWWDKIKSELTMVHVNLEEFIVNSSAYNSHNEGQFIAKRALNYAHQADFIRLRVLSEHGGVYADMDTLFVNPMPDELYRNEFVIGYEGFREDDQGKEYPSLCNALMLARPNTWFVNKWLENMYDVFDGTWDRHSCDEASRLGRDYQHRLKIAPQCYFYKHSFTAEGIASLFEKCDKDFTEVYSMHLWNHLWWDKDRTDFSNFHHELLNEEYIRNVDTSYTVIARKYLDA